MSFYLFIKSELKESIIINTKFFLPRLIGLTLVTSVSSTLYCNQLLYIHNIKFRLYVIKFC